MRVPGGGDHHHHTYRSAGMDHGDSLPEGDSSHHASGFLSGAVRGGTPKSRGDHARAAARRSGLAKLGIRAGHYEVVREMCKVVDRHVELGDRNGDVVPVGKYDKLRNGFCVVFPYHRVIWDLRTPTAMQSAYFRALVETPMATPTHVVADDASGGGPTHYVRCDDDKPPLAELHPAAFTVAGLVLCYGAPVESLRTYTKYELASMGMADPTEHAHADRCNKFKEVLAFLQYVHLQFGSPAAAPADADDASVTGGGALAAEDAAGDAAARTEAAAT